MNAGKTHFNFEVTDVIPATKLIQLWQDEAEELDARAARVRTSGGGRFQVQGWETRAQALWESVWGYGRVVDTGGQP
jgi:hypothetical protein